MKKFFGIIKKFFFAERQIVYISNSKIKSKKINPFFFIFMFIFFSWFIFSTLFYINTKTVLISKNLEFNKIKEDEDKYYSKIKNLESSIDNILNFLVSLGKYDRLSSIDFSSIKNDNTYKAGENYKLIVDRSSKKLKKINTLFVDRILSLNKFNSDIDPNIKPVSYEEEYKLDEYKTLSEEEKESIVIAKVLEKNLKNIAKLEEYINLMPFAKPVEIEHISSKYGKRSDPFTKEIKEHHGVDLIGPHMTNVATTAPGKVIYVGNKTGYGKTVIVEHKNNFKTLYGHLKEYKVKVGDVVKRGDFIGIQGNTGRSTGEHLHYEIFKNDKRYNPEDFIKVGTNYFN